MKSIPLTMSREELLATLNARMPAAKAADKKALDAHRKQEVQFLENCKKGWREALKWDYETAKKKQFTPNRGSYYGPSCPMSKESELTRLISMVERTGMRRFVITEGGKYDSIYRMLTADVPKPKGLC
jgi:endonuclease/exonuclease/phosphatase (EEP) superfamily protein YafD